MLKEVQVKLLHNYHEVLETCLDGEVPQLKRGTPGSAGYDLIACVDREVTLFPGDTKKIPTGIAIWINDPNYVGKIYPRSGKGLRGLVIGNLTGIIDSDYQGEIFVCVWNRTEDQTIKILPGEAIAQICFEEVQHPRFLVVDEFKQTTYRNYGGFGSTDRRNASNILENP